jgi:hypothetical protein
MPSSTLGVDLVPTLRVEMPSSTLGVGGSE